MVNPQNTEYKKLNGLGWWNLYFIIKIILFTQGKIDFHPVENITLVVWLLLPLSHTRLALARTTLAIPAALWLFHYDSFLPPLDRLWGQIGQLLQFDTGYLFELAMRFISLQALMAFGILIFAYYFLNQILRISVFVILAMLYISVAQTSAVKPVTTTEKTVATNTPTSNRDTVNATDESGPVNDVVLNQAKQRFFDEEAKRTSVFPSSLAQGAQPFDLLFLSICSVAWDDIEIAGLADHPLFKEFDIMFDNFSAATSYSGPALIRLLRASCGQEAHEALFSPPASKQCYLFDNLAKLGYEENLLLNHNGQFDDFIGLIKQDGDLGVPMMSQANLPPYQSAFDGSHVYRDADMLKRWLEQRQKDTSGKVAALYNSLSLHDGNRIISASKEVGLVSYTHRLKNLLDDLYAFFQVLKASKRNIVVVLVPEHGAGMRGDKMQISGMREIPAKTIVHTPVALKVFGPSIAREGETYHVTAPSSYLALSDIISRMLEQNIYANTTFNAETLAGNLPETKMIAQNSGTTVMEYNGKTYISLDNETWEEYPTN